MRTTAESRMLLAGRPIERGAHLVPLLESSRLMLDADPFSRDLLQDALPSARVRWSGKSLGMIRVLRDDAPTGAAPAASATMSVSGVQLWSPHPSAGLALLRNAAGSVHARVDRDRRDAVLRVHSRAGVDERAEAGVALGLAFTLLVSQVGHAVVHAAAVIAPDGSAWLLVGDSHAGKSSAVAALVAAGWDYVSDDTVVLSPAGAGIRVEGWREEIRLDRGFGTSAITGDRVPVSAAALGSGRWRSAAMLGGLLFPRVHASEPTRVEPIGRAAAFVELVRQSPWLFADRGASPAVAALLCHAAEFPLARLTLGQDSYANAEVLACVLSRIMGPG